MMITMESCEAGMWENEGGLCSMNRTRSLVIRFGRECPKDILESGYQRSPICIIAAVTLLFHNRFIEFSHRPRTGLQARDEVSRFDGNVTRIMNSIKRSLSYEVSFCN